MKKFLKQVTTLCLSLVLIVSAAASPVSAAWSKDSAGQWIYTNAAGSRVTGWQKISNTWYYFNSNGVMCTGWQKVGGYWYYLRADGAMATGWLKLGSTWYYLRPSGVMATGWQKVGNIWYYFNGSGDMRTGWLYIGGKWYFFDQSGAMATGWINVGGKDYYMTSSGAMATGSLNIDGVTYSFDASGACIGSTVSISNAAEQVLALVNEVRAKEGLPALLLSDKLCAAAEKRAEEQSEMGRLVHKRPDGSDWYTILTEYGVSNLSGSAENLASGVDTAEAAVKAWMESASHKQAILGDYSYMGVGSFTEDGVTYWAQLFSGSDSAKNTN